MNHRSTRKKHRKGTNANAIRKTNITNKSYWFCSLDGALIPPLSLREIFYFQVSSCSSNLNMAGRLDNSIIERNPLHLNEKSLNLSHFTRVIK